MELGMNLAQLGMKLLEELRIVSVRGYAAHAGDCVVNNQSTNKAFNSLKVFDLVVVTGDVHHIFPKKYLQDNGYNDKNFYNQVANYAYLDTSVNISVGKKEPKEYFSEALAGCNGIQTVGTITDEAEFWANLDANCIPHEVVNMTYADYTEFLKQRRVRMAQKIRKYYYCL